MLHLADAELYSPKWTDQIHNEWTRNLLLNRPDLTSHRLQRTVEAMNVAFPDASINHYEPLISGIELSDPDDRHILAAAILGQAHIIVTANLKDFPNNYLSQYDIEAQHPDNFIMDLLEWYPEAVIRAFQTQVINLKNPPKTALDVIQILHKAGLEKTANGLAALLQT